MRDDDIKNGNLSGGMPTGFQSWALADLKTKAADPFYSKQIQETLQMKLQPLAALLSQDL